MFSSVLFKKMVLGFTAIPLFFLLTGCHNFYKITKQQPETFADATSKPEYQNRYFILRSGKEAYHMNNLVVSEDKKYITCHLDSLPAEHTLQLKNGRGGRKIYKPQEAEVAVLNEVHLFVPADSTAQPGSDYTLTLAKVERIEVIEKNGEKTSTSYVLGGLGITIGVVAVAILIALALKSSCPFVSAYNDNEMKLQGEIYGGAIYPQLCRNDYLKLAMSPAPNGRWQLQISNELKEKQFTDIAELITITHDKNAVVMADENGGFHSVVQPVVPVSAMSSGKDILPLLTQKNDSLSYTFDDTTAALGNNTATLAFSLPANTTSGKLVLRLKNSYWLDMVYGKFTQGFGRYYPTFIKKQSEEPAEKLNRWKEAQNLPLQVAVLTDTGWQIQHSLITIGPLANREMALPVDVSRVKNKQVNIRLSAGFMFWDIDYAAMDFTGDIPMQIATLQPVAATDETGASVLPVLQHEDKAYLQQPVPGNAAVIEYPYTPLRDTSKTQTCILHVKGYYEHVRDYTNAPDIAFLKQFKQPGALSGYSMALYKQAMKTDMNSVAKK